MIFNKFLPVITFIFCFSTVKSQENFQHFTVNNGLPSNQINSITQDHIGYLWIATDKGIVKFDGINFEEISIEKTDNINFTNHKIFAKNSDYILIKNHKTQKINIGKVLKIIPIQETIFLATESGISILKNNAIQPLEINSKIDKAIVYDIIYSEKHYFVSSSNGLWKVNNLEKPSAVKKLNDNVFNDLEIFEKQLIASSVNDGIIIFEEDKIKEEIKTIQGVSNIKKIKNEFWISSYNEGVEVLALPSFAFKKKINKYNSLVTNRINTVFKDPKNYVYIGTNKGLYRYNLLATKSNKPKVFFENLVVNNQNLDSLLSTPKTIRFSNSENNITVNYKTVDLLDPNKVKYRFRLNSGFNDWTTNHQIQFANLNYGNYTLTIQSKIGNNLSPKKSISFKINTPIYMELWFIILIVTIILIITSTYLHFYLKNIEKKNNAQIRELKQEKHLINLEQKALQLQMNPHFIFNVLNGIKGLGNANKLDEMNESISLFSSLLRTILQNSMKEDISLHQEIIALKSYLELEKRMNSITFNYVINTKLNNIDPHEIVIPSMLIQPFVENSIKHGFIKKEEYNIIINFVVEKQVLRIVIIDDGVGLNHDKKEGIKSSHKSVAVQLTKERIQNISKRNYFLIEEIKEKGSIRGTKVSFSLPLVTDF